MSGTIASQTLRTAARTDSLPIDQAGTDGRVTSGDVTDLPKTKFLIDSSCIITDATTSRTLSSGDNGKVLYFTSSSAITVTTATGLCAGFSCLIIAVGSGQITIVQGASTTRVNRSSQYKSAGQYAEISILCPVANTFIIAGDTAA